MILCLIFLCTGAFVDINYLRSYCFQWYISILIYNMKIVSLVYTVQYTQSSNASAIYGMRVPIVITYRIVYHYQNIIVYLYFVEYILLYILLYIYACIYYMCGYFFCEYAGFSCCFINCITAYVGFNQAN